MAAWLSDATARQVPLPRVEAELRANLALGLAGGAQVAVRRVVDGGALGIASGSEGSEWSQRGTRCSVAAGKPGRQRSGVFLSQSHVVLWPSSTNPQTSQPRPCLPRTSSAAPQNYPACVRCARQYMCLQCVKSAGWALRS